MNINNDPEKLLKSAEERHVWQLESEVLDVEEDATIRVADGTQIVGADGKLHGEGQSVTLPAEQARAHVAAGRAVEAKRKT